MSRPARRLALVVATFALAAGALPGLSSATASTGVAAATGSGSAFAPVEGFRPGGPHARVEPESFAAVRVDLARVRDTLRQAPPAASSSSLVFAVPTPTGGSERFAVRRSTVMEAGLAAAHPEITTYAGRSLDHGGTTIALDVTPMGFHASVRGPVGQQAWYVDPAFNQRGAETHLSYYGGTVPRTVSDFAEKAAPEIKGAVAARAEQKPANGKIVKQRIYRLALTSDPAYASYFGTANVLAEKVTLINRVNQIYNDDLAINLRLVNATDDLNLDTTAKATGPDGPCGAHACFDAATPGDPNSYGQLDFCDVPTLGRNRTVLGQIVGASNYDIGHIALGVNGGGIAYLGVVGADYKGGGCTGLPKPEGDFFAIDYVAHEMGHQFGANHTFDGTEGACSGGNRHGATSVEPGSGSSVMAYAGICGTDDLQPHTDPYFSQRTISEVTSYTVSSHEKGIEVQTVSLRGFDTDGDTITLDYPGAAAPITLTRGTDYNATDLKTALETLTGSDISIAGWGYDPRSSYVTFPAPITDPDDTGFQVIFGSTVRPGGPGDRVNVPSLTVTSSSSGVSGFVGETARGGSTQHRGSQIITTDNHAPKVKAPANRTLPVRTPFTLKGSGTDRDGDKLTYLWEQNDTGRGQHGTGLVSNDKVTGALFRVFGISAPVTNSGTLQTPSPHENLTTRSASRTFPDLKQVLAGTTNAATGRCPKVGSFDKVSAKELDCYSEFLPTGRYTGSAGSKVPAMHFRLTARDGDNHGGGTSYDDVVLKVSKSAGPFLVTSQAKKTKLAGGSRQLVTWKVNGTEKLAAQVRIVLSTDGGKTWKQVLARRSANDGSQLVTLPDVRTKKARIKIVAVDNYFFAVNASRFRIR